MEKACVAFIALPYPVFHMNYVKTKHTFFARYKDGSGMPRVVVTGGVFAFIFHVGLREIPASERALQAQLEGTTDTFENSITCAFTWKQWFREPQFYVVTNSSSISKHTS